MEGIKHQAKRVQTPDSGTEVLALCFIFGRLGLPTRTRIRRLPRGVVLVAVVAAPTSSSTPITTSNVPASAHGSYWWCDVWCLVAIAVIGVTALITSLFINLAYLRHTPSGGPVAPWRDDDGKSTLTPGATTMRRPIFGWLALALHSFCSKTFHLGLSYPNPYSTTATPLDVGCTSLPFPNATGYQGSSSILQLPTSW